jgi:arylsulfatase A-like enzyme
MNRRDFLLASSATAVGAASLGWGQKLANSQPNIILFLVDDLGWGDFGCYGDKFHETPNIDKLASEGLKFTNAYAAAPVCSPSRAGLLTGQAPARLHLTQWLPGSHFPKKQVLEPPTPTHMAADVPTIAQGLKAIGYKTCAIGKWHLGGEGYLPENFGFDVNIAGDNHGHPPSYFGPFNYHNLTGYTVTDYLTEVLTAKAEEFLGSVTRNQPFFLYMAEYAVHMPLQAKQALVEKYKLKNQGKPEPDPVYAAMVEYVDIALGAMRKTLEKLGMAENTILIVTSDNGGVGYQAKRLHRIADNGDLRAGKGFLYEGGIREPLIVHWPGVTRPGSVCDVPVTGLDFMPTLLNIAHGKRPAQVQDGMDITGLFRGETELKRDTLYWHYPHYSDQGGRPAGAIREGDWKLIEFFEDMHIELYNLSADPGERYDLSSSFQDKADDLRRKLHEWRKSVDAAMPRPNPEYNEALASLRVGAPGCSWEHTPGCLED